MPLHGCTLQAAAAAALSNIQVSGCMPTLTCKFCLFSAFLVSSVVVTLQEMDPTTAPGCIGPRSSESWAAACGPHPLPVQWDAAGSAPSLFSTVVPGCCCMPCHGPHFGLLSFQSHPPRTANTVSLVVGAPVHAPLTPLVPPGCPFGDKSN